MSEQKTQTEQEYQNKLQEIENLNQQLNEFVEDLVAVKESKEQLSQELNEQLQNVQNINVEQSSTIESQNEKLQKLQKNISSLKEIIAQKEKESLELNETINIIVNDLANMKESKCWIYTKPLRDIQKVFKGDENE